MTGISAKIVADSISETGTRITTYELEYPRFIHSEFMTHRLFSRNAASSRAIPVKTMLKQIWNRPARPIHWGANQSGMQAKSELKGIRRKLAIAGWDLAAKGACIAAWSLMKLNLHKQAANRILEPFCFIKVVVTATDYDNFFWLRCHPDAQPEIRKLAEYMWAMREYSVPVILLEDQWHVPYYKDGYWAPYQNTDRDEPGVDGYTLSEALMISASQCAQVSFRKADDSLDKAQRIYRRLVDSKPVHSSPFEHQATPIGWVSDDDVQCFDWPEGVTHYRDMPGTDAPYENLWSGNFRGWIQYRQLIDENACWQYNP